MSIYPPPSNTNIFNEKDFNNINDDNDDNDDNNNDLNNYIKKNGDTMTGKLELPELEFYDLTKQTTAFTNDIKNKIYDIETDTMDNTIKLTNFDFNNNYSVIDKIKTNELNINNIISQPFQSIDKNKIYENEGNIIIHSDLISSNSVDILTLENNVEINSGLISDNSNTIVENTTNIGINTGLINTNITNIGVNSGLISTLQNKTASINESSNYTEINKSVLIHGIEMWVGGTSRIYADTVNNDMRFQHSRAFTFGFLGVEPSVEIICNTGQVICNSIVIGDNVQNQAFLNTDKTQIANNTANINSNTANINSNTPIGSVISFAGSTAPTGWLICNGAEISTITYNDLYQVIGSLYNDGRPTLPSAGNFFLPDLRQSYISGAGSMSSHTQKVGNSYTRTVGEYNQMSVQDHGHNYEKSGSESSGNGSLSHTVGSNNRTTTKTSGTFYGDGIAFPGFTQPNNVCMNMIIKY